MRAKDDLVWSIIKILGIPGGRQGKIYGQLYKMEGDELLELEAQLAQATEELKAVHKKLLSPAMYAEIYGE